MSIRFYAHKVLGTLSRKEKYSVLQADLRRGIKQAGTTSINDIPNVRFIRNNVVSGPTLENRPLEYLKLQKKYGIDTIIDFRAGGSKSFASTCDKNGFKYYNLPLDGVQDLRNAEYFVRRPGKRTEATKAFFDMIKQYFGLMKKGNAYIGCQYGIDRTNMGVSLDYFLNMDNPSPPPLICWPDETMKAVVNRNIKAIKRIFKSLSENQKKELKLPDTYEELIRTKVKPFLAKSREYTN